MRRITLALLIAFLGAACGGSHATSGSSPAPAGEPATVSAAPTSDAPVTVIRPPTTLVTVALDSGKVLSEQPVPGAELVGVRADQAIMFESTEDENLLAGPTRVVRLPRPSGDDAPVIVVDGTGRVLRFDAAGQRTLAPARSAHWPGAAPVTGGIAAIFGDGTIGLDAVSGAKVWRAPDGIGPPVATGETVVTMTGKPGAAKGTIAGFDARTGKERWRTELPFGDAFLPVIVGGRVFVTGTNAEQLTAEASLLDLATGRIVWTISLGQSSIAAAPVAVAGMLWVAFTEDDPSVAGRAVALSMRDGRIVREIPAVLTSGESLVASGDAVALPTDDALILIDAATGAERWRVTGSFGAPIIVGDRLYAVRIPG